MATETTEVIVAELRRRITLVLAWQRVQREAGEDDGADPSMPLIACAVPADADVPAVTEALRTHGLLVAITRASSHEGQPTLELDLRFEEGADLEALANEGDAHVALSGQVLGSA